MLYYNHNKNNYDRINVIFPQGYKDTLKAASEAAGESVNGYIKTAVDMRMEGVKQ